VYKAGLITPRSSDVVDVAGHAIAAREPGRNLDLYFDFDFKRFRNFKLPPNMVDTSDYPDLLSLARKFASLHSHSRFALLRIWTAPHFYPYMLKIDGREPTSFLDEWTGRTWEWKFIPKDMPGSEWSVHYNINNSLKVYRPQFKDKVIHRRDVILVMADGEEELAKLSTAVTYAVQDRPWLREIDLWKSFINVDLEFLEELDKWWLE
jgi:hypothetical protein